MSFSEHLLFLDFDGVTHPEGCAQRLLFCRLPLLLPVLQQSEHVNLVISSTWRETRSLDVLKALFPEIVRDRVIGATPRFADLTDVPPDLVAYQREAEVNAWLREHRTVASDWTALDDRSWLFKPFHRRLVLTHRAVGIDDDTVAALRRRFGLC